jgi:hypothetical protein
MRASVFNVTFIGAALIATGGWIWFLFVGLKWIIEM